jgi:hypothetical protein
VQSAVRGTAWSEDPRDINLLLIRMSIFLVHGRAQRPVLGDEDEPPELHNPRRFVALLEALARGRAILYGRNHLEYSDLALPMHLMFSSMPDGRLVKAVVQHPHGLSIAKAAEVCGWADDTAKARMDKLTTRTDLVEWDSNPPLTLGAGRGPSRVLRLQQQWHWLEELSQLLEPWGIS